MKTSLSILIVIPALLTLSSCVTDDGGYATQLPGSAPQGQGSAGSATQLPGAVPGFSQPLTADAGQGAVTIREGSRTLCSFRTASPNVEQTRWYSEQEQIVVKSRGNHGPATVQLFDSRTGRELGRVMAFDIRGGQPSWAASMGE